MIKNKRNKFLKLIILFAKTYFIYLTLLVFITVIVSLRALFNETNFVDLILYWLPADFIIAFLVTVILILNDYRTGRLKEKLR